MLVVTMQIQGRSHQYVGSKHALLRRVSWNNTNNSSLSHAEAKSRAIRSAECVGRCLSILAITAILAILAIAVLRPKPLKEPNNRFNSAIKIRDMKLLIRRVQIVIG